MAFGSALGRLARRRNRRRRPCEAGRDAGGRSTGGVAAAPGKRSSCASSFRSPNSRAPTSARKSHLSAITVRRTWAGPFPSLRRRPNIRSPSSFPNRTAASSSFSPKRRPPKTQAALLNPGQPVTVTPAAGPPYATTSSTSAGLRKSFGKLKVVEGFSLQVAAGEICGFLGANGSGKTTTIRMLCGLLKPDGGRRAMSRLQHHPPAERNSPPGRLHDAALQSYEDLTVFENLDFVAHVYEMAASSGQEPRPASQHQLNAS